MTRIGMAIGLVAGLLTAPAAGGQEMGTPPPLPPPGRLIDIGGWRLHLNCTGQADASRPTVILEAGIGDFSVDWSLLQPRVATVARVCSYDRAGSGWSDLGPSPRTMKQIVWELRTLLEKAGEHGPYLLVGHSWGGLLVRQYAYTWPAEVVGMVLVESGHENSTWAIVNGRVLRRSEMATGREIPAVKSSGPLRESDIPPAALRQIQDAARTYGPRANEAPRDKLPADAQRMRLWATSQVKHYAANDNDFEPEELVALMATQKKIAHPLGDIPLVVLSRGRPDSDPESEAVHTSNQLEFVRLSSQGRQVIALKSGHHIQVDEPELVLNAIRGVMAAVKK